MKCIACSLDRKIQEGKNFYPNEVAEKLCGKKERRIKDLNLFLKLKAKRKRNSSIFVRKKRILREEEVTTFIIL